MSIIGRSVGGPAAVPDFKETDETAGGYIKNKPDMDKYALESYVDQTVKDAVGDKTAKATVTLTVSGWSDGYQTVSASGVTADNAVLISVPESSYETYMDAGIRCVEQQKGKLKFKCESTPDSNITVGILSIN